jgi:hypothetical protein
MRAVLLAALSSGRSGGHSIVVARRGSSRCRSVDVFEDVVEILKHDTYPYGQGHAGGHSGIRY